MISIITFITQTAITITFSLVATFLLNEKKYFVLQSLYPLNIHQDNRALEIRLEYGRDANVEKRKRKRLLYFHFKVNDWMKSWIGKLKAFHLGVFT